jgi:hypothetical protein
MPAGEGFAPALPGAGPVIPPTEAEVVNLLYMKTEIRQRLGEATADWWSEDEVLRAINTAMYEWNAERRWSWLYTTRTGISIPANTSTYVLEPDVNPTRHFNLMLTRAGNTIPDLPERVTPKNGFRLRQSFYTAGVTAWYYLEQAALADVNEDPDIVDTRMLWTVRFVPTPSVGCALEYQYIRQPLPLVNDEDIPDIPKEYVNAPISWATGRLWLTEFNGQGKAQEQYSLYESTLQKAILAEDAPAEDEVVTWGGEAPNWAYTDRDVYTLFRVAGPLG